MSKPSRKPGPYPKDRTKQCYPFEVVGVAHAGLNYCRSKSKTELKS